ncbi:1,2-dihydroxy-3-keto-5-methylthiopentene dioxygenase-like [Ostrinia furnacalis]|uniref:1,2-dihydroxy-3-keto-5-methylthiopentene dioxygenase-like n=1 Tax=Ostrinia furnacalis TaxID=93504 RepID=UPI00103C4816|nr:1,2-dihydroxy-3-keto-5-methylthiopentene dioxygenase-like [Ostrinia furnacalis]
MNKAWYMDDETSDQRLQHHRNPPEFISLDELYKKTGVEIFVLNVDTYATDGVFDKIKKDRGYSYEDELVCSKECFGQAYEEKLKSFYTEHIHTDEEIRFVLEGSGYFDVRDDKDQWIRILVTPGDLVVLPKAIYHRFTLDTKNHIKVKRLFIGTPVWQAYNRPADDMECRRVYVSQQRQGFATAF